MTWVHRNGPALERTAPENAGRAPDLKQEVVSTPPGPIAPDRGSEIDRERHLISLGLRPAQPCHERVATIPHPVDVSRSTVEPEGQTALGFEHLKRHPLAEGYPEG